MNKEKFLIVSVVFLFVLNAGIVAFLLLSRPPHPGELWKLVVKEVGFDEQQTERYLALRDAHRANMNRLDAEFAETLNQYLNQLQSTPDSTLENSLSDKLAYIEKQKAEVTLQHFRAVRALCAPEQLNDFNRLIPKLTRVILPPKKDLPPRRN